MRPTSVMLQRFSSVALPGSSTVSSSHRWRRIVGAATVALTTHAPACNAGPTAATHSSDPNLTRQVTADSESTSRQAPGFVASTWSCETLDDACTTIWTEKLSLKR